MKYSKDISYPIYKAFRAAGYSAAVAFFLTKSALNITAAKIALKYIKKI